MLSRVMWTVAVMWMMFSCDTGNDAQTVMPEYTGDISTDTESGDPFEPVERKPGFANLAPREIGYIDGNTQNRIAGTTREANLFYALVPADTHPEKMPLMVILNGGPSGATTALLFAYGTAPYMIDSADPTALIKENPNSYSAIANLLYIDTRLTGFSYEISAEEVDNYHSFGEDIAHNAFTDVSDILLTLLDVMEKEPALADNPVVFTGESYGGARLAIINHLLSDPTALLNPESSYYDPVLGNALKEHFKTTIPNIPFEEVTADDVFEQFGWQVMLQPGWMLPNYDDYAIGARCKGMSSSDPRSALCNPNTDMYDMRLPSEQLDEKGFIAGNVFLHPASFELIFGIPPQMVEGLAAMQRGAAVRTEPSEHRCGIPSSEWITTMGELTTWDYYYIPVISGPSNGISDETLTTAFMNSLAHINTFITYAYYDKAISCDKIPTALMNANAFLKTPLVASANLDLTSPSDKNRPGEMTVVFTDAMKLADPTVKVRMPLYDDSGHTIPLRQARALRDDIADFLEERGAYK